MAARKAIEIAGQVNEVTQGATIYKGYAVAYMFTRTSGTIILERGQATVTISMAYKPFASDSTDILIKKLFTVSRDAAKYGAVADFQNQSSNGRCNNMCPKCCVEHRNCPVPARRQYQGSAETRRACVVKVANDTIDFTIALLDKDHPLEYAIWYRDKGRNLKSMNKSVYERYISYVACCSIAHSPDAVSVVDYTEIYEFTESNEDVVYQ